MTTFFTSRGSGECKLAHLKSLLFYLKGPPRVSGFTLFSQSDTTHIDGHTLVTIPRFTMQNHFISSSPIRQKGNNYCAKGLTRSRLSHYIHFFGSFLHHTIKLVSIKKLVSSKNISLLTFKTEQIW